MTSRADVQQRSSFFFFNDTATTEIYTLSLHDALPICPAADSLSYRAIRKEAKKRAPNCPRPLRCAPGRPALGGIDRKSTRLNSSHGYISYAVFCLKKKRKNDALRFTPLAAKPTLTTGV